MKPSPNFIGTMMCLLTITIAIATCSDARADTPVVAFGSLGFGHRNCDLTDAMICDNEAMGSNLPGFISFGLRAYPQRRQWHWLWADEIELSWRHQSYANRGVLIPGVLDFGGQEAQFDADISLHWVWRTSTLFTLPF